MAKKKKQLTSAQWAVAIISQHPIVSYRDDFYEWAGSCYRKVPTGEIEHNVCDFIAAVDAPTATASMIQQVVLALKHRGYIDGSQNPPFRIDGKPHENPVVLQNHTVLIDRLIAGRDDFAVPHNSKLFATLTVDFDHDPKATCPQWLEFLHWFTSDKTDVIQMLQDFCGWCLLPELTLEKFVWLVGSGKNGKSVYAAVIRSVLGEGAVSSLVLSQLRTAGFEIAASVGRRLNIVEEVQRREQIDTATLKRFVSQQSFSLNRKFRETVEVTPTARLLVISNEVPHLSDHTEALWRRMLMLKCEAKVEQTDVRLTEKLIGESPGIFNWILQGACRVARREALTEPISVVTTVRQEKLDADATATFIQEIITHTDDPDDWIPYDDLFDRYKQWMAAGEYRGVMNKTNFKKAIRRAFGELPEVRRLTTGFGGSKRKRGFSTITWKNDVEEQDDPLPPELVEFIDELNYEDLDDDDDVQSETGPPPNGPGPTPHNAASRPTNPSQRANNPQSS